MSRTTKKEILLIIRNINFTANLTGITAICTFIPQAFPICDKNDDDDDGGQSIKVSDFERCYG